MNKDQYFMKIAKVVSTQSKCLSRQIGAVLVRDSHIIATGYNGPPMGVPHCEWRDWLGNYSNSMKEPIYICPRERAGFESGEGLQLCPAVHAEMNTILEAARFGISTMATTIYCYCGIPCKDCAKELINAGVWRVVHLATPFHPDTDTTGYNFTLARILFEAVGVQVDAIELEEDE